MSQYHPHEFDLTAKKLLEGAEQELLEVILEQPVRFLGHAQTEFVVMESQRPDLLFSAELSGQACIIHLELQTRNEPAMLKRMLAYWTGIFNRLEKPVYQVVLYLGKAALNMPSGFAFEAARSSLPAYHFELVDVRDIPKQDLLSLENPACLPWLPIVGREGTDVATLREVTRLVMEKSGEEALVTQRERLFKTEVLAGLRFPRETIAEVFEEVLKMLDLRESETYQMILEEGMEKGNGKDIG